MNAITFSTLSSLEYVLGLAASGILLSVVRQSEKDAEKVSLAPYFDPVRRVTVCPRPLRVRLGAEPALTFGRPMTCRFFSPSFLLGEVLPREPISILPFTLAWLLVLAGEPLWCAIAVGLGGAWRCLVDYFSLPPSWSRDERMRTVALKTVWCVVSGMWLASLAVVAWAVFLCLLLIAAMVAAGASKNRRWRR